MRNLITFRENLIEPFKLKPISIRLYGIYVRWASCKTPCKIK